MIGRTVLLAGRQCPRRAWLATHRPELAVARPVKVPQWDLSSVVHGYWPQASVVPADASAALRQSARFLADANDATLAKPIFQHAGVRVRLDVLAAGVMIELRAGTRLKPRFLTDCAIKAWVAEQAGVRLRGIRIATLDPGFVYRGGGDYRGILREHDVTEPVRALMPRVSQWLAELETTLAGPEPSVAVGPHCQRPPCPFFRYCNPPGPEYPVSDLRSSPGLVRALQQAGYDDLREVPERRLQKPLHRRIRRAAVTGEPQVDPALREFVATLGYPRYYLDFEAVQFAVPIWPGTRPFQALPFQWSCHVEPAPGAPPREHGFLDLSGEPPMRAGAEQLLAALGETGPVLAYGDFERRMLGELARWLPERAAALKALRERVVDLLPWLRGHYYHRDLHGSWSLKQVLGTLGVAPPQAEAEVAEGLGAQRAYLEAIAPETAAERREALRAALAAYCSRDTEGMLLLVRHFAVA